MTIHRIALSIVAVVAVACAGAPAWGQSAAEKSWYDQAFFLLHEDYHTQGSRQVGRDTDASRTKRLVRLAAPDFLQIHAKGNPGWTTYPSEVGHTPPKLEKDVLRIWRDVAAAENIPFSAYFNLGRDGVIMDRRPQWNRHRRDGTLWERALCYHTGVTEEYLVPMLLEIVEKYEPDGFWMDGSCFTVSACWCEACKRRFTESTGQDVPRGPDDRGWDAFQEMHRTIYRQCIDQVTQAIHAKAPDCLIAVNWAYSVRMPERPAPGIAYLTGDIGNRVEGLPIEGHYYDSTGYPFDLMTQLCTRSNVAAPGQPPRYVLGPKPPIQIQQEMAIIIANGGRYHLWDSPTPEGAISPERYEFIADVVRPYLRQRQPWCVDSQRVADAALLHSRTSHYAVSDTSLACFPPRNNRIDGAAQWLTRLKIDYHLTPTYRLVDDKVDAKLLVVEHPKRLTREETDAIERFARNGGTVLLTGMATSHGELRSLMGITDRVTGPDGPERLRVSLGAELFEFSHWLFRVDCDSARSVITATDAEGTAEPLLTHRRCGRGDVYYAAVPLLSKHGKQEVPAPVVEAVLAVVLPPERRTLLVEAAPCAHVIHRRQNGRDVVHLVNMGEGTRETIELGGRPYRRVSEIPPLGPCSIDLARPNRPGRVYLVPGGDEPSWSYDGQRVRVSLPQVAVHAMVVVE